MKAFGAALRCELLKARRSRVPPLTALAISLAPLMAAFFMLILRDPERARRLGVITTKAQIMAGAADWPTYLGVIAQATAIGGLLVFSFLAAWVFGREFSDRTVKTWLAVPTPRSATVWAKLVVAMGLSLLLAGWVFVLGLVLGAPLRLPGGSPGLIREAVASQAVVALLTVALIPAVALVASAGRGYLAPLAFTLLTVFLAQIMAATGWGDWFPWSVPALRSGMAGPPDLMLGAHSYVVVVLTAAAGVAGALAWWRSADHTG